MPAPALLRPALGLLAAGLLLCGGCASGDNSSGGSLGLNQKGTKGLSPITTNAPLVGDTQAPAWFGIGATGPVFVHVFYPANPIITLWSGQLVAGDTIRIGHRKQVIVEYSNGSNLYYSLGDRVETATKARFGKDPIP